MSCTPISDGGSPLKSATNRLEDRRPEIALRPKAEAGKLTWEQTAREMADAGEDWSEWEAAGADGLEQIPWERAVPKVARASAKTRSIRGKSRAG
ncbi:hypothetical protein LBMAG56_33280 [Verrucomicrobiota bacterium]|nr:hypothetical protein LBMAG56_33280 [Verrucomicrobiota bacterium]